MAISDWLSVTINKQTVSMRKRNIFKIVSLFSIFLLLLFCVYSILPKQLKENIKQLISPDYVFGIDVSHHQGNIQWDKVSQSHHPIDFVFVRATVGKSTDRKFHYNWREVYNYGYTRGAYHYFQPMFSGKEQFQKFAKEVILKKGDLPPVLDIEYKGSKSAASYRKEVLIWLKLAEKHYNIKPIIYTGYSFYQQYLKGYINNYPLWIANYSGKQKLQQCKWTFHQLTDKVSISGIKGYVDGNDFKGSLDDLEAMTVK